jgi:hypothetical protein
VWEVVDRPGDGAPWTVRDVVSGQTRALVDMPGATCGNGDRLLATAVPLDTRGATGFMGVVPSLSAEQLDEATEVLRRGASIEELAEVVVGPSLPAVLASYDALAASVEETERRLAWVFPDDDVTAADIADEEGLLEVLADWGLWVEPGAEPEDEPGAIAASNVAFAIAVRQLVHDDPPEVWETAMRLQGLGYERLDVVRMLASTLVPQLTDLVAGEPFDPDRQRLALDALPDSAQGWLLGLG